MSIKVARDRFMLSSLKKRVEFYQHLNNSVSGFQALGNALISQAESFQAFRDTESLEEIGTILTNMPIKEFQLIGQYYLAWCGYRRGENTCGAFEKVIDRSNTYKGRAFLSLAALVGGKGDHKLGVEYYAQAARYDKRLSIVVTAARSIAVIKSREGSHKQALVDLEQILPLARYANPKVYFDYLNSLAVEYLEAGRVQEAQNISKIVLASPYAFAYPEWHETGNEITLRVYKSRSSVPVIERIQSNISYLPKPRPAQATPVKSGRARVLSYSDWKKKMVKKSKAEEFDKMTDKDLAIKIFELAAEDGMTWRKLRRIVDYIIKVHSEPF